MSTSTIPLSHPDRKDIFTALYNRIIGVTPPLNITWQTTSQYLRHWDEVSSGSQPALFFHRGQQIATQAHSYGATKWVWQVYIWIYYRVDALKTASTYPDELTDVFLDWAETALQADEIGGQQTLGGLVYHCAVEGTCLFDSGINDNQAVLVIPISVYV